MVPFSSDLVSYPRLHFNFRIGADVPKVAVEGKFGPRAYTSIADGFLRFRRS